MWHFPLHSDYLFREAPARETNAADYLMRMCERTLQSPPGGQLEKSGGYIRARVQVLFVDRPTHGFLDLLRISELVPILIRARGFISLQISVFFSTRMEIGV